MSLEQVICLVQHLVPETISFQLLAVHNLREKKQDAILGGFTKKVDKKAILFSIDNKGEVHPEHFVLYDHLMLCEKHFRSEHPGLKDIISLDVRERIPFSVLGAQGVG